MTSRLQRNAILQMNEALLLGLLRLHEMAEARDLANARLTAEIEQRIQSERDALTLTSEISHRIKNNLQTFFALISNELRRTPAEYAGGYIAMQARIGAIAGLYELISRSGEGETVQLDVYLQDIANRLRASLLEPSSAISIELSAEPVTIEAKRAEAFGLLVNELCTNAIRHAFPGGAGRVSLGLAQLDDQICLTVADDGVGMAGPGSHTPGQHGSDYVEIFARQLRGELTVSSSASGVTVQVTFPASSPAPHEPGD